MIFFLKDRQDIATKLVELHQGKKLETFLYAEESLKRGFNTYWTCLDDIDYMDNSILLVDLKKKEPVKIKIPELHAYSDIMLFKTVGSVENQLDKINHGLLFLKRYYKGTIVNDPETIVYGSNKNYLVDLQKQNFPVIPTDFYSNKISEEVLRSHYSTPQDYVIKSATGELSNSLSTLDKIDEAWLRRKENKVGGWVVQPIDKNVWNGEYQLVFFGDKLSHSQVKVYKKENSNLPTQQGRDFRAYQPSPEEVNMCRDLKGYVENDLKKRVHYFRCDFFHNGQNKMSILEFEMVNPGFFLMYRQKEEAKTISSKFIDHLLSKSSRR